MKFNWGYGIACVYLVFVTGILYMVWNAGRQKVDLVTPDYYEKELKFQDQIDASNRAAVLSEPLQLTREKDLLQIRFPKEFTGKKIQGTLVLYCPSDVNKDLNLPIEAFNNEMKVDLSSVKKGWYQVQVNWNTGGPAYYFQKDLFLN